LPRTGVRRAADGDAPAITAAHAIGMAHDRDRDCLCHRPAIVGQRHVVSACSVLLEFELRDAAGICCTFCLIGQIADAPVVTYREDRPFDGVAEPVGTLDLDGATGARTGCRGAHRGNRSGFTIRATGVDWGSNDGHRCFCGEVGLVGVFDRDGVRPRGCLGETEARGTCVISCRRLTSEVGDAGRIIYRSLHLSVQLVREVERFDFKRSTAPSDDSIQAGFRDFQSFGAVELRVLIDRAENDSVHVGARVIRGDYLPGVLKVKSGLSGTFTCNLVC